MTALLARGLDTWDLDSDRADDWRDRAACAGRWQDFTEQMMPTSGVVPVATARAVHLCIVHCPVLLQCTLAAETPGKRPMEMVQAGLWWPGYTHRPPRTLPDPGHGTWCAHLRRQR